MGLTRSELSMQIYISVYAFLAIFSFNSFCQNFEEKEYAFICVNSIKLVDSCFVVPPSGSGGMCKVKELGIGIDVKNYDEGSILQIMNNDGTEILCSIKNSRKIAKLSMAKSPEISILLAGSEKSIEINFNIFFYLNEKDYEQGKIESRLKFKKELEKFGLDY
jgi:hypothetical protein